MTEAAPSVPELQPGDRLTRDEFERRYAAMPQVKKAELVEGVVYMPSPVSLQRHGEPAGIVAGWLTCYAAKTPGVQQGVDASVLLDLENMPQPDALLRVRPGCGGQSRDARGYVDGAPELVVEVAASSVSYDLHDKLRAYKRNGVREYVVWRVDDHAIDWFRLVAGDFRPREPAADGLLRSDAFPGLWLDVRATLLRDLPGVFAAVDAGCRSSEHRAFTAALARGGT